MLDKPWVLPVCLSLQVWYAKPHGTRGPRSAEPFREATFWLGSLSGFDKADDPPSRPLLSSALSLLAEGFHEELLGAMASDGLSVKVTKVVVCVVYRFNSVLEKHQNRV